MKLHDSRFTPDMPDARVLARDGAERREESPTGASQDFECVCTVEFESRGGRPCFRLIMERL